MGSTTAITETSERTIRAIFEFAARIGCEQQLDELVRLNADFARDLSGADRCSLWLIDEDSDEMWTVVAHGVAPLRISVGSGLVGTCIREDRTLLVNEAKSDSRFLGQIDNLNGYCTKQVLCVPLHASGKVIGALQLLNKPSGFTDADVGLLCLLAQFAASAIENDRLRREAESIMLTRHELKLAQEVQTRLLPDCPLGVVGLECVGFCRPARVIGGDYYDLLPLQDGRFAFTLGDVSGKGVPAAVMMASIQTLLRYSLLQSNLKSLTPVLADLNRTLYASSTAERYTTLFCGMISADRSTLSYVNAGHVSPLLRRRDGRMERLPGGGFPVGLLPECAYEQYSSPLAPGDTLVVVSDGILDACNKAGEFWEEREVERILLDDRLSTPLAQLPALFSEAVDRFAADAEQYDDMTVVALRIK